MNKNDLLSLIKNALEVQHVDSCSSMDTIQEWDSLGHLSILSAIDERLDGKAADLSDLASATSVEKIISILEKNSLMS
jgi:acyl carrier protein